MGERDPLRALEAIYTFDNDDESWVTNLVDAFEPYSWSGGLAAYISSLGERVAVTARCNRTRLPTAGLDAMPKVLPAAIYRHLHAPMPLVHSREAWPKAGLAFGMPEFAKNWARLFGVPPSSWAICGGDVDVRSALVVFHCSKNEETPTAQDHAVLDQLGAHLGAALRLRSLIAPAPAAEDASVGAVISPDGNLLHAQAREQEESARGSLIDAVRRSEKVKLRRATAEERLETWTALVEGKWSILESVERDGKRLLLAYRNPPVATNPRARELTERERAVAQYAALGHPLKFIAYELGIAISTAALDLENAIRKLGITNRAELIHLFARAPRPKN